jgi:hypothetical protein
MSFHRKSWPKVEENTYRSDEMDALVRWALRDSVAGEEPPPEVWHKIRSGLEQPKAQAHPRRGRLLLAQSWLVQLLVLSIILLTAFDLSLSQGFDWLDHEVVVNGRLTPQPGSEEAVLSLTEEDVLSGPYLFHSAGTTTVVSKTSPLSLSKSAVFERTSSFDGSTELAEVRPRMTVPGRKRAYKFFPFR